MNHLAFSPELTVAQALDAAPATSTVFMDHRTACVGCYLARFCTLREVAKTYGLSPGAFLGELQQVALADPSYLIGALDEKCD